MSHCLIDCDEHPKCSFFRSAFLEAPSFHVPSRGFMHATRFHGLKATDSEVPKRFFRLDWGGWIKRLQGAHKRVWKMSRRRRLQKELHFFVEKTNSKKFDRMVTREYRTPKFFVDDIYEPYQKRNDSKVTYYISAIDECHRKLNFPELTPEMMERRRRLFEGASIRS